MIGNGGLIPSGNEVSGTGLWCTDFVCTGSTQADHEPSPGTLNLPPLWFETAVCTDKFNVRP